ncbi:peptide MFS transporter [Ichthyobacterium seriolicida]|uniref:Amino acid permease n=1 Tax=Ichthyobacterium seriolicida TaxID=242600 RepID=A0A1J1EAX4_9FLAO|nr:oligopeptide:H+ symporter [Ichthyobacterium seriolicida]BAV95091.1 amino acid permease [Ichthyobacterium seriolicida]
MNTETKDLFKTKLFGHPVGLFILFFTEMWERFSYYGMRALLVIFLITVNTGENPGWSWERENALSLLGTYALLVYLTPVLGGYMADKKFGYRKAVIIGAVLMTLGHTSMAIETPLFLYIGIGLLALGNGFFKPNITSIISEMYKNHQDKKDAAYTIFYMGVNSGAFLGIMLCGYIGEKISWSFGFGLAGIFMFLGMLQFWLASPIFGSLGEKPKHDESEDESENEKLENTTDNTTLNPFTIFDKILIGVFSLLSLSWIFNDPVSKIGDYNFMNLDVINYDISNIVVTTAFVIFLFIIVSRIVRYDTIVRDRLIAIAIFAILNIFFWACFEQAAGSLAIFAKDYTFRALSGESASLFKIIDTLVTVIPLLIISYVLYMLFSRTYTRIKLSNIILGFSFVFIWAIVIYKLYNEFSTENTEVPATWFGILNSLFIIVLAPLFSKWWESKYNPTAAFKYGFGLILLGLGFSFLVYGSMNIPQGAETASISMAWLILAYLFHTMGELCLSPLGLSYLSKLVPPKMLGFMFGIFYLAMAIGNKIAHSLGGKIDDIVSQYDMATFFLIFTLIPILVGIIIMLLNPLLKKLMHGVR